MRIALLTAHYQPATRPCGIGDHTRCLRHALERRGHDCLVITSASTVSEEKDVHQLSGRWGMQDLRRATRILRTVRPDVVLLQYTPEHYGYGLAFKLLPVRLRLSRGGPIVVTIFHTLVGGRSVAKLSALLLAAASHGAVSVHAELSALFRRRLRWWAHKLSELPIGANIPVPTMDRSTARHRLRQRLGLSADTHTLATFGFACPGKGLETLFRALDRLNQSGIVHLLCVGESRAEDQDFQASLESLARTLGIDGRIHWLRGLPGQEVSNLLLGVDAYVVPYDDGASLRRGTLMAGFQVGVPIVTTVPRHPDDALKSGETLLAIPPRSPVQLAEGIHALLGDQEMQARLRRGAAMVAGRFAWDTIALQLETRLMTLRESRGFAP